MTIHERVDFSRLTQAQVAEAHRKSSRTIREWSGWGMPRNEDGTYNLAETIWWRLQNSDGNGVVWRPWA